MSANTQKSCGPMRASAAAGARAPLTKKTRTKRLAGPRGLAFHNPLPPVYEKNTHQKVRICTVGKHLHVSCPKENVKWYAWTVKGETEEEYFGMEINSTPIPRFLKAPQDVRWLKHTDVNRTLYVFPHGCFIACRLLVVTHRATARRQEPSNRYS